MLEFDRVVVDAADEFLAYVVVFVQPGKHISMGRCSK